MQEYYFGLVPGEEAIDRLVDGVVQDPGVQRAGDAPAHEPAAHLSGLWRRMRVRWSVAHPDTAKPRDPSRCI